MEGSRLALNKEHLESAQHLTDVVWLILFKSLGHYIIYIQPGKKEKKRKKFKMIKKDFFMRQRGIRKTFI